MPKIIHVKSPYGYKSDKPEKKELSSILPNPLLQQLMQFSKINNKTPESIIIEALEIYLDDVANLQLLEDS